MMRKGPLIRLYSMRWVMSAMVWMVFPNPFHQPECHLSYYYTETPTTPDLWSADETDAITACHLTNLISLLKILSVFAVCLVCTWYCLSCPFINRLDCPLHLLCDLVSHGIVRLQASKGTLHYHIHRQHPALHACLRHHGYYHNNRIPKGAWDRTI